MRDAWQISVKWFYSKQDIQDLLDKVLFKARTCHTSHVTRHTSLFRPLSSPTWKQSAEPMDGTSQKLFDVRLCVCGLVFMFFFVLACARVCLRI